VFNAAAEAAALNDPTTDDPVFGFPVMCMGLLRLLRFGHSSDNDIHR
jgi:hypothetical protein